jgi:hypothetical protein
VPCTVVSSPGMAMYAGLHGASLVSLVRAGALCRGSRSTHTCAAARKVNAAKTQSRWFGWVLVDPWTVMESLGSAWHQAQQNRCAQQDTSRYGHELVAARARHAPVRAIAPSSPQHKDGCALCGVNLRSVAAILDPCDKPAWRNGFCSGVGRRR